MLLCFPDQPAEAPSEAAALKRRHGTGQDNSGVRVAREAGFTDLLLCKPGMQPETGPLRARFWLIAFAMGLPLGVYQAWTAVLFLNLEAFDFSQSEVVTLLPMLANPSPNPHRQASWLGCLMTVSGCLGSIAVGAIVDRCLGRLKTATSTLMVLSTTALLTFSLAVAGAFPLSHTGTVHVAYVAGILAGFFFNCTTPLYFEMMMETVFGWGSENGC